MNKNTKFKLSDKGIELHSEVNGKVFAMGATLYAKLTEKDMILLNQLIQKLIEFNSK